MTTKIHNNKRGGGWRIAVWGSATILLLTPLIAMQLSSEVHWTGFDFAVFGVMLLCACGVYELLGRAAGNHLYQAAACVAIATAFLLVWANLAVGVIGDENNPANLMYGGVLAIGVIGAAIVRLKPRGMARILALIALAHAAVPAIAAFSGPLPDLGPVAAITGVFTVLWLTSAGLFSLSARQGDNAHDTAAE